MYVVGFGFGLNLICLFVVFNGELRPKVEETVCQLVAIFVVGGA